MNEILENLYSRRSVRSFEDKKISAKDRLSILNAAVQAPTAGNQQLYTILDITDQSLKEKLSVTCDNQPFIAKAPMVLIFCADFQKWYDAFLHASCSPRRPARGDLLLAVDDALIAAQNAVTAAWSLGIGSCYIGDIMEQCETHRKLLNLPDYVFPDAMLVFGYPTSQQLDRPKPKRCPLDMIVHQNTYRRLEEDELQKLLGSRQQTMTWQEQFQAFCQRKYNSDFSKEMSRSVEVYLKTWNQDPTAS